MSRETVWERRMLVLLRCMDALMQDYRDVYGENDGLPASLEEEFGKVIKLIKNQTINI